MADRAACCWPASGQGYSVFMEGERHFFHAFEVVGWEVTQMHVRAGNVGYLGKGVPSCLHYS